MRLDLLIVQKYPNITRSQAKRFIEDGHIKAGGVVVIKPSHNINEEDTIEIDFPQPKTVTAMPEDIPLNVLYEDKDIIVINKDAGMVVHPGTGNISGTLVNALLHHSSDLSGIGGELKPGIVHRLDKGTSGVMVIAKNDRAHLSLSNQFKARSVEKRYYALVYGRIPKQEGTISIPIGRHRSDRKKMSTKTTKGRAAVTEYRVAETFGNELTLVDIRLATGRTHQIRVHFSHMGHPLVGDDLYGGVKTIKRLNNEELSDTIKAFSRPALHAYKLTFAHPESGEKIVCGAPIPADMESLIGQLRNLFGKLVGVMNPGTK